MNETVENLVHFGFWFPFKKPEAILYSWTCDMLGDMEPLEKKPSIESVAKSIIALGDIKLQPEDTVTMHPTCYICGKVSTNLSNLYAHIRAVHKTDAPTTPGNLRCPLCTEQLVTYDNLQDHITNIHKIEIENEYYAFGSDQEFQNWKYMTERATLSTFVKLRGKTVYNGVESVKYFCHRSGNYVSKTPNRKRSLKMAGSNKVGYNCPARIFTVKVAEGCIEVEYVKTHVGHGQDVTRVYLTKSERRMIAEKIKQKVPADIILDDIRTSASEKKLERLHLLTRKDINNIARDFKVRREKPNTLSSKVPTSVDEWVQQMRAKNDNPVRFHKRRGELLIDTPDLTVDDFMLVIMTEAQKEKLMQCNDIVVIDSIPGADDVDLKLITIFTVDNKREVFPCTFIFINRQDEATLKVAFRSIEAVLGNISPSAFVSEDEEYIFRAWHTVFGLAGQRFLCDWHVRRAWRNNVSLIKGETSVKKDVQDKLFSVLEQTDKDVFHWMLDELLTQLKTNTSTKTFGDYIYSHYAKRSQMWAYCYRSFSDVNMSVGIENVHRIIKYEHLHGRRVVRLDKSIHALMSYHRDKQLNVLGCVKKKVPHKLRALRKHHRTSLALPSDTVIPVDENTWEVVPATETSEPSRVQYIGPCQQSCLLYCAECKACCHNFTCTCRDHMAVKNMCKHIHLVCRVRQESSGGELLTKIEPTDDSVEMTNNIMEIANDSFETTDNREEITSHNIEIRNDTQEIINENVEMTNDGEETTNHSVDTAEYRIVEMTDDLTADGTHTVEVYVICLPEPSPAVDTLRTKAIQDSQPLLEEYFGNAKSSQDVQERFESIKSFFQKYEAERRYAPTHEVNYVDGNFYVSMQQPQHT